MVRGHSETEYSNDFPQRMAAAIRGESRRQQLKRWLFGSNESEEAEIEEPFVEVRLHVEDVVVWTSKPHFTILCSLIVVYIGCRSNGRVCDRDGERRGKWL